MDENELDDYFIFADIMEDNYNIMSAALYELGMIELDTRIIYEHLEEMKVIEYMQGIRRILSMSSTKVKEWKLKYIKENYMIEGVLEKLAILIDEVHAGELTNQQIHLYLWDIYADIKGYHDATGK